MPDYIDLDSRVRMAAKGLSKMPGVANTLAPKPLPGFVQDAQDSGLDVSTTEMTEVVPPEDPVHTTTEAVKTSSINMFQHPDAHPVVLDLLLLMKYGPEWMTWESETLEWRVPQDFRTSGISDLNMHKIQAMKAMHFVDSYWEQWEVFNWCTHALNGIFPDFDVMQVPTTAQIMVSVDIASRVREDVPWTQEVKDFMTQACRFDGIYCLPEPLHFLPRGSNNGLVNCEEIFEAWPKVQASGVYPESVSVKTEQLRRMLDAKAFLDRSRARLQQQIRLVSTDV